MLNIKQTVEQFHLIFLDHLGRKIDKRLYILKGGCNLRFYFKSFRYSEDIDFDIQTISIDTLRKHVTHILESKSLLSILQMHGMAITQFSAPKQTETTQRWKVTIEMLGTPLTVHTKIEFFRRQHQQGNTLFEAIDHSVTQGYHLPPIFLTHYDRSSAITQKICALAERHVIQARDVFDLYLLSNDQAVIQLKNFISSSQQHQLKLQIAKAIENLNGLKEQDFQSQVVSYLSEEYQKIYSSEGMWTAIANRVREFLLGASGGQNGFK